jgi:broad specificity phosphatase PhoE
MKTLLFVRHGATAWNATGQLNSTTDLSLSAQGRHELQPLTRWLKTLPFGPIGQICCSPLQRAQETSQLLHLSSPVVVDDRLRELDFGCFEGHTPQDLAHHTVFQQWYREDNPQTPPSVESFASVVDRAESILQDLLASPHSTLLTISHGAFLRILLSHCVLAMPPSYYRRIRLDNGKLSAVLWDGDRLRLTHLNLPT